MREPALVWILTYSKHLLGHDWASTSLQDASSIHTCMHTYIQPCNHNALGTSQTDPSRGGYLLLLLPARPRWQTRSSLSSASASSLNSPKLRGFSLSHVPPPRSSHTKCPHTSICSEAEGWWREDPTLGILLATTYSFLDKEGAGRREVRSWIYF